MTKIEILDFLETHQNQMKKKYSVLKIEQSLGDEYESK